MQQREKLVDILLTKDGCAILKVLEVLRTRECGYEGLVAKLISEVETMQKSKSTKPQKDSKLRIGVCVITGINVLCIPCILYIAMKQFDALKGVVYIIILWILTGFVHNLYILCHPYLDAMSYIHNAQPSPKALFSSSFLHIAQGEECIMHGALIGQKEVLSSEGIVANRKFLKYMQLFLFLGLHGLGLAVAFIYTYILFQWLVNQT